MEAIQWLSPNLSDGIGNRLFQFAASAAAAKIYGRPLVFFLPRCYKASHSSALSFFSLFPSIPIVEGGVQEWMEIEEKAFATYEPFPENVSTTLPIVLRGFRQSPKYFDPIVEICPDFEAALGIDRLQELKKVWFPEKAHENKTAFIHIRLGDYLLLPHHYVDLRDYWIYSLQKMRESGVDRILVFSDDTKRASDLLPFFQQIGFSSVHIVLDIGPIESLFLMSLCKGGAICANSTFSWWGAYFARSNACKKIPIFMPQCWGSGLHAPDIHPDWSEVVPL